MLLSEDSDRAEAVLFVEAPGKGRGKGRCVYFNLFVCAVFI